MIAMSGSTESNVVILCKGGAKIGCTFDHAAFLLDDQTEIDGIDAICVEAITVEVTRSYKGFNLAAPATRVLQEGDEPVQVLVELCAEAQGKLRKVLDAIHQGGVRCQA